MPRCSYKSALIKKSVPSILLVAIRPPMKCPEQPRIATFSFTCFTEPTESKCEDYKDCKKNEMCCLHECGYYRCINPFAGKKGGPYFYTHFFIRNYINLELSKFRRIDLYKF